MATNYPGGLDSLSNPSAGSAQTSPSHAAQHANANDAIEAIQGELGTDPSGSASTVNARIAAIEADSRWTDQRTPLDQSVTPAKFARPIGNLLTDSQARPVTVGAFWSANATEPSPGVFVASGSGPVLFTAEFPVEAYMTYTGWADVATQGRDRVAVMQFVNAAGSILLAVQSSAVPSGTRGLATVTAEAPAGAVRASIYPAFSAATPPSGETITVITAGAWVGAGGRWRPPGVPIPDLGVRPNPTAASQVQVWNASAGTWITV